MGRVSDMEPHTRSPTPLTPLRPPLLRYKSDIKQLVDQIHKELRKVGQTVGVGEASGRRSGGHAPSELVDFLSSVCVTDNRGHEDVQCWVAQLMCGLVSEGVDPHNSSLIYHLRLLADKGPDGRLKATSVQISTATLGKLRPAYRHDAEREPDEEDETYARDASNSRVTATTPPLLPFTTYFPTGTSETPSMRSSMRPTARSSSAGAQL